MTTDTPTISSNALRGMDIAVGITGSHLIYQILTAPHSINGNPQRLTMVYDSTDGYLVRVIDHGHLGDRIPSGSTVLRAVSISRQTYHDTVREAKQTDVFCAS